MTYKVASKSKLAMRLATCKYDFGIISQLLSDLISGRSNFKNFYGSDIDASIKFNAL